MSTPALTPQQFAAKIRSAHPGAYDDVPDDVLTQKVLAKYPEYHDMVADTAPQLAASHAQSPGVIQRFATGVGDSVGLPHPVQQFRNDVQGIKQGGAGYVGQQLAQSAKGLNPAPAMEQVRQQAMQEFQNAKTWDQKAAAAIRWVESGIPFVGPQLSSASDKFQQGDIAGGAGQSIGMGVQLAAAHPQARATLAELPGQVKDALPSPRGVLADKMAEKPVGSEFTRGQVVDAAKEHGVNLDLAQATDSGALNGLKKANRYSIASQTTYDTAATKNVNALEQWAGGEASKYSPDSAGREVVGPQIQQALKSNLETKKAAAQQIFNDIDSRAPISIDATSTVESEAKNIIADNKDYYAKHPELQPTKAWKILQDLAERPQVEVNQPGAFRVGPGGEKIPTGQGSTTLVDAPQKNMSWSELHQLRSDLMDFYRNNPDVVKGRSEAWIQRMVGKIDETMTNASSGLSADDLAKFRQANDIWGSIKNTYDNPQSPYYHAVRSQFPSQVPGMLTKGTPELAQSVRQTLGSLEGPFQRQFVEQILNDKGGNLDLKNLNSRLSRIPNDFLESMLGADGTKNLKLLAKVAQKVTADSNPSGTAKVGVPAAEVTNLFHNPVAGGLELGTQYGGAKLMNSQRLLNYLTQKK